MLSDEWLSRYGLLENFNASVTRTRKGTGTWTTGVTAIALCTSCSRAKNLKYHVSCHIRKPTICIGKNKGADQLCSNRTADQHLCFRYMDSTIPLLKSEISSSNFFLRPYSLVCVGPDQKPKLFVFSCGAAHVIPTTIPGGRLSSVIRGASRITPLNRSGLWLAATIDIKPPCNNTQTGLVLLTYGLMSSSTIFQSCRDGFTTSWVLPVVWGA